MTKPQSLTADESALLRRLLERAGQPLSADAQPAAQEPTSRKARKKPEAIKYLNEEELARLFAAVRAGGNPRDIALFEVAYHRGLRASEVALIELKHWRQNHQRLYVTRLKGGISGEYLVTDAESKALRSYLRKRPSRPGALFLSRQGPIKRGRLDQMMRAYARKAGLPEDKQHFHCLRHACATSLLERDVPVEEVQDHLGHTDIRNTMKYAKVTNAKRRRKDERLKQGW